MDRREMLKGTVEGAILVATGNTVFAAENANQHATNQDNLTQSRATFTPSGVGAVSTTLQSKLQEIVSVRDFGAVGNGIADDTLAIRAAMAASVSVKFPSGVYKITSSITIPNGVRFFGDSKYFSKILLSGDIEGLVMSNFSTIENMRIIGNNSMSTDTAGRYKACLLLGTPNTDASRFKITNIIVGGMSKSIGDATNIRCSGAAIKGANTFLATIEETYVFNSTVGIEQLYVSGVTTNAVLFKQVECHSCGIGARFGILNAVTFDTCTFENNDQEGLILGGCRSVDIINPYFEANNRATSSPKMADLWIGGGSSSTGTMDVGGSLRIRGGFFSKGIHAHYGIYADNQRGISIEYPYFAGYTGATNVIFIGTTNTDGLVSGYYNNSSVASSIPSNFIVGNYEYAGVNERGHQVIPLVNTLQGTTAALSPSGAATLFAPSAGQMYIVNAHATNNNIGFRWSGIIDAYSSSELKITILDSSNIAISDRSGSAILTNTHGAATIGFSWVAIRIK